jgi:hypothetical protein
MYLKKYYLSTLQIDRFYIFISIPRRIKMKHEKNVFISSPRFTVERTTPKPAGTDDQGMRRDS